MKQILTLLIAVIAVTTAFAQTDAQKEEAKRVILGEKKGSTSYPKTGDDRDVILGGDNRTVYGGGSYPQRYPTTSGSSREQRIYDINREYDAKIYSIRNNRSLSQSEKERIIRQLEIDRRRKINEVNNRYYGDKSRRDDDHDNYKKSKKYKHDNGNHYGWEKGKGNPHHGKN